MTGAPFFAGRVAIVTGASAGIGRAIAVALGGEGASVALAARRHDRLEAVAADICHRGPGRAIAISTDVSDDEQVERLVRRTRESLGPVDLLVNSAGFGMVSPVTELDLDRLDAIMRVNFRAVVLSTKLVLPEMIARRSGAIVNIGSASARRGWPTGSAYVASKFALRGFALCLFQEVRRFGIRVITVHPDFVASEFFAAAGGSLDHFDRAIPPADVAASVLTALKLDPRTTALEIDVVPTGWGQG